MPTPRSKAATPPPAKEVITKRSSSPVKVPKTLGACADRLYALRTEKASAQALVDVLDEEYKAIKEHLIQNLPKSAANGITGKTATAQVKKKEVPQVKDWPKLQAYIIKNKAWELMQRRVSDGAVQERWDAGKQIPGIDKFTAITVSVTKR